MTVPPKPPVGARQGTAGLAATGVSIAVTIVLAALGPSIMEPALPGPHGQPPWALAARPSPDLAVALAGLAILTGTIGLALSLNAMRRGWRVPPRLILAAGIIGAIALALLPPFGSSDHLSYAAYGRMAITGHNPYTTTPAALARLGDPVAAAVQDWRHTPSVYGPVAVAGQALAAKVGGDSVRLIVFVLSLLNVLAFVATGLMLHWLSRGDPARQLRAALLWTANPLLLTVLVAGEHVDSQSTMFGVGAVAVAMTAARAGPGSGLLRRQALIAAGAGALVGLGFAIKVTTALVGAGLAIGVLLAWHRGTAPVPGRPGNPPGRSAGRPGRAGETDLAVPADPAVPADLSRGARSWYRPVVILGGLAAGFAVIAAAALIPWGTAMFGPALQAGSMTSIGSPWRAVRSGLRLVVGEGTAENAVKAGALVLAVVLLAALLRYFSQTSDQLLVASAFAVVFAWLLAWPYVLPWYDGLGWALLVLLPWSRLDWLMLARTAALAVGYLPARGIVMPSGLRWLETVVRTAVTPAVLLAVVVIAIAWLWPRPLTSTVSP